VKLEMRRKLARETFEEKVRKVAELIELAKRFPKSLKGKRGRARD